MSPPKACLFDIGGVCVISPMQAIQDYERAYNIPPNWVNFAISRSSRAGAWQRAERGETPLDDAFFTAFRRDLHSEKVWEEYHRVYVSRQQQKNKGKEQGKAQEGVAHIPPMPVMDTTTLFWMMMIVSRHLDPHMGPALETLRSSKKFLMGALSNTVAFPPWHPFGQVSANEDVRKFFDVFVGSSDVGLRKPEREIYELAVRRLDELDRQRGGSGVRAEDVLFLDDIGENLKAAKKVGMRTIRVWLGRTEEAVKELEEVTGLKLSEDRVRL